MAVPSGPSGLDFRALRRREQGLSAVINAVLSAVFFAIVFGLSARPLTMASPDRFALDFVPQGVMVSLMASLVPTLLVRAKLRGIGLATPASVAGIVLRGVACGVASALVLAGLALFGPLHEVPSHPALAFKVVYGALLGLACTRLAVSFLFDRTLKEQAA
ncbi:hypothetical protein QUC32_00130 [Novosphingobium resinovorum]|uniref:Uncharacterized protein n=1 Tax=Novosphingobium resinovorum TaxID=158500 RepID=A0A031JIC3_9SPHN|nr:MULTISPECIES: hypothetical protein [Novosphingobium]AOR79774.1 hypothetical protein BES08_23680 [Novosphingobium resinovorum]EZP73033.1 hypothetical protein BV97_05044 [Novosphingobium resinovorum]MBF7013246.1 hypothetical protein [Novosphingobium sp. HR1a]WJM25399.1 hypothetical protein QUC32_00130 [Novosphingobium resinovorum]